MEPDQLSIGDRVICGSGDTVPVDGPVLEGQASVNQSSITGESVPIRVEAGMAVISGSVIEEGRIVIKADRVGRETALARVGRFLELSLRNQSDSQAKAGKVADRLVPVTFGTGLGLYALTGDLRRAASALTVDYACPVKLATPVAVRTSMYQAAKAGVLLKGAQALESLSRVDTLVFDKTGTLTTGRLRVTDVAPLDDLDEAGLHGTGRGGGRTLPPPGGPGGGPGSRTAPSTPSHPSVRWTSSWPMGYRLTWTDNGSWWGIIISSPRMKAWTANQGKRRPRNCAGWDGPSYTSPGKTPWWGLSD